MSTNQIVTDAAERLLDATELRARWGITVIPKTLPFVRFGPKLKRFRLSDVIAFEKRLEATRVAMPAGCKGFEASAE